MAALNVVRFRVRPGFEEQFVEAHRNIQRPFKGFLGGYLIKTGDRAYCWVGEWQSFQKLADARPLMVGILDEFRHMLEDLGAGMGVTDPVSGESVARLAPSAPAKRAAKKKTKKAPAARSAAKKRTPAKRKGAKRR